jgi:hypothetical protein
MLVISRVYLYDVDMVVRKLSDGSAAPPPTPPQK